MAKRRPSPKPNPPGGKRPAGPLVDQPSPRVQAARGLWDKGQRADALALFAEAIRQEPDNVRTYVMAARAYSEKYDFALMESTHDQLVRRAPQHPGVHHYIGETFCLLKLPDRAIAAYRRAADLPGAGPPTWMELASLYEHAHQLDEAQELMDRTVASGFDHPLVGFVRGRILRRQKRNDEAESAFRDLLARLPPDVELAAQVWSELALMCDAQGDYPGAIEAIGRCKQIQIPHQRQHLAVSQHAQDAMRTLVDTITAVDFRRWREAAAHLTPVRTALLTGFPRSGTTLLEQVLDAHPELVSSEERDFIGRELVATFAGRRGQTPFLEILNELDPKQIERERARYFRAMEYLLAEPIGSRMHLDKNPAYNQVIPLVLRTFPEARLLVALRDPRDVVLSCYMRYLPLNAISVHFLTPERTAQRYAFDMTAWLRYRDLIETPWREVRYEDTVADLPAQARATLETLGLPWSDEVLHYRQRLTAGKKVTSPTYEAVAQPIYTKAVGRWKHYEELLAPAMETLVPFIREFGYEA